MKTTNTRTRTIGAAAWLWTTRLAITFVIFSWWWHSDATTDEHWAWKMLSAAAAAYICWLACIGLKTPRA